jgi:hypothetical protein
MYIWGTQKQILHIQQLSYALWNRRLIIKIFAPFHFSPRFTIYKKKENLSYFAWYTLVKTYFF